MYLEKVSPLCLYKQNLSSIFFQYFIPSYRYVNVLF